MPSVVTKIDIRIEVFYLWPLQHVRLYYEVGTKELSFPGNELFNKSSNVCVKPFVEFKEQLEVHLIHQFVEIGISQAFKIWVIR